MFLSIANAARPLSQASSTIRSVPEQRVSLPIAQTGLASTANLTFFLDNWGSIADSYKEVLTDLSHLPTWLRGLTTAIVELGVLPDCAGVADLAIVRSREAVDDLLLNGIERSLLDPSEIADLLRIVARILSPPKDDRASTQEDVHDSTHGIRTLERIQGRFISALNQVLHDIAASKRKSTTESSPIEALEWTHKLESVWWASFRNFGPDQSAADRIVAAMTGVDGSRHEQTVLWRTDSPNQSARNESAPRRVVVIGAGIAGLTAAHELADRGFDVCVIEQNSDRGQLNTGSVQAGGVARTQWAEVQDTKEASVGCLAPELSRGSRLASARRLLAAEIRSLRAARPSLNAADANLRLSNKALTAKAKERFGSSVDNLEQDAKYRIRRFPGEHGYRFFPSFYRHMFDTMKRTTIDREPRRTAFDQLEPTYRQVFARSIKDVPLSRSKPRTIEAFRVEYMQLLEGMDFPKRDIARFFFKLLRYLTMCNERREKELQDVTFMQFLGGDDFYSDEFRAQIKAAPQALVAMDADHCDARTQCNVYLQLLVDQVIGGQYTDMTLNGPTSTAWIDRWTKYLTEDLGVTFVRATAHSLVSWKKPKPGERRFDLALEFTQKEEKALNAPGKTTLDKIRSAEYVVCAVDAPAAERLVASWDGGGVPRELFGFATQEVRSVAAGRFQYEIVIEPQGQIPLARALAQQELRKIIEQLLEQPRGLRSRPRIVALNALEDVTGYLDFQGEKVSRLHLTLWFRSRLGEAQVRDLERFLQLGVWSTSVGGLRLVSDLGRYEENAVRAERPRLSRVFGLTPEDRFQTFTGVQYYFHQDFKIVRGHVYLPDTDWGLSAISQGQFWQASLPKLGDKQLRGVLSVDIGATNVRSQYTGKTLIESSREEIAEEVWRQIEDGMLSSRGPRSRHVNLPLPKYVYYHVDQNLVFQGSSLAVNTTPFLINNAGDWERRPKCMPWVPGTVPNPKAPRTGAPDVWQAPHGGYRVHGNCLVFAGHYMRTFTRMTTMEAATESARHAVNAILDHASRFREPTDDAHRVSGDYCEIFDIESFELEDLAALKRVDQELFKDGYPTLADILGFDSLADLQHPRLPDGTALGIAVGTTFAKDWGIDAKDVVATLRNIAGLIDPAVVASLASSLSGSSASGWLPKLAGMAASLLKKA